MTAATFESRRKGEEGGERISGLQAGDRAVASIPLTFFPRFPPTLPAAAAEATSTSSLAAPLHAGDAGCNGCSHHLAVGALGVMNGVEDRDRRANFPSRALSVEHPAVLPAAAEVDWWRRRRQLRRSC